MAPTLGLLRKALFKDDIVVMLHHSVACDTLKMQYLLVVELFLLFFFYSLSPFFKWVLHCPVEAFLALYL